MAFSRLEPTPEEMHSSGEHLLELMIRAFTDLRASPPFRFRSSAEFVRSEFEITAAPRDWRAVLDQVATGVLPFNSRPAHPRFFAFVPGPSNWWGVWGDALARAYNTFAGCWYEGAGASMIEAVTIDWLSRAAGYGAEARGALMSGGSIANLAALAAARTYTFGDRAFDRGTIYYSDQTHSSVERALRILGFRSHQLRRIASDKEFRLPPVALKAMASEDRAAGLHPFCVVANAGTTNTGAVDPLSEIAEIAAGEKLWMHVDGAFGGAAVLCGEGRRLLPGIERSDSLTLDPHKWLFQPFDCGCVLFRDGRTAHDAFHMTPEYLQDTTTTGEVNFWDFSPELTRPFRALKLWMTLQVFGADAVAAAIEHGFDLARCAQRDIGGRPHWTIVTPAQMAILTFRFQPPGMDDITADGLNRRIGREITQSGFAVVLSTELRGRTVLRLCPINPRTSTEDIAATVAELDRIAQDQAGR